VRNSGLSVGRDAGAVEIGVKVVLEGVVAGQVDDLAALLAQAHP
jgi:hypothetical protein